MSETGRRVAAWIEASGDNRDLPYMIIDKGAARVFVFDKTHGARGDAAALLGFAVGDHSTPGVGDRELSDIAPEERTTPAGRFIADFGPAPGGKSVLWIDYETAISLHPVIDTNKRERRPRRLSSATIEDNRITFGCVNVTQRFYDRVVRAAFRRTHGVVYVTPETLDVAQAFPAYRVIEPPSEPALRIAAP